jgi:hypothetical protein
VNADIANTIKIGAWIHERDLSLADQLAPATQAGLQTIRCYSVEYAKHSATAIKQAGVSLMAGMRVDGSELVQDWRSQVRLEELARYHELGIPLEAICVGNELREGGDEPYKKRFTARLSFGLANVIAAYRHWLNEHGYTTPVTYAMEGIVFDREGNFYEWLWPLIDACDVVSLNAYPMDDSGWFTYGAFEESRRFLHDARRRHDLLTLFETNLRRALQQVECANRPLLLSETGFPSAVGYHVEGERFVAPESDNARYAEAMFEFASIIRRVNADYAGRIRTLYFYEWRDNLYHDKIWNVEQSPIHTAFGLCDRLGAPKLDVAALFRAFQG